MWSVHINGVKRVYEKYGRLIDDAARRHGVPPEIITCVIWRESRGRANALAKDRVVSYGLMQITYEAAREVGYQGAPEGLLLPENNIEYATRYLAKLYRRFKDWSKAIAAYNCGPGRVERALRRDEWLAHIPGLTRDYLAEVIPLATFLWPYRRSLTMEVCNE